MFTEVVRTFIGGREFCRTTPHIREKIRDAGDRLYAEFQRLQKQSLELNDIFSVCKMWIFIKDLSNNLLLVNDHYASHFGVTADEMKDTPCDQWFEKNNFLEADRKLLETKRPVIGAIEPTIQDGKKRVFRSDKYPMFNTQGEIYAILGIAVELPEEAWPCLPLTDGTSTKS